MTSGSSILTPRSNSKFQNNNMFTESGEEAPTMHNDVRQGSPISLDQADRKLRDQKHIHSIDPKVNGGDKVLSLSTVMSPNSNKINAMSLQHNMPTNESADVENRVINNVATIATQESCCNRMLLCVLCQATIMSMKQSTKAGTDDQSDQVVVS